MSRKSSKNKEQPSGPGNEQNPQEQAEQRIHNLHPGSSREEARQVGGKGDFGVRQSDTIERAYTSRNAKQSDPGAAQPRSGSDGSRESGAGGYHSGPASSSGGDLDPDIIGFGSGGGVSASGKTDEPPGPDDATGTSADFASGPPAKGTPAPPGPPLKPGETRLPPDDNTTAPQGADAASTPLPDDDSFAGEISSSEATGRNDAGD